MVDAQVTKRELTEAQFLVVEAAFAALSRKDKKPPLVREGSFRPGSAPNY